MERSHADRILEDWAAVSSMARRPAIPVRSVRVRTLWSASTLATAIVLVVAIAVAGVWLDLRRPTTALVTGGSASPSPSAGLASWWVDPATLPLADHALVIRAFIREQECANGMSPEGRVLEPTIEYGADAIVITFMVEMRLGDCPSNPSFPVDIRLAEPVAARALLDGSEDPPRDATMGDPQAAPSGLASWWVDPLALPLADDARVIPGFIRERACASGTSPEGRVLEPTIEYRADAIVITYMVEMLPGGRCPSNPSFPVEIRLVEPLGGRVLLDGSEEPPRDATREPGASGEPWGPLAVVPPPDTSLTALAVGTIRITDECALLEEGEGEVALLVWPADRTAWDATARTIAFLNVDGTRSTLRDGDQVTLGGGGDSTAESGVPGDLWVDRVEWVARPAPSCPNDVRWSVSEVVPGR